MVAGRELRVAGLSIADFRFWISDWKCVKRYGFVGASA